MHMNHCGSHCHSSRDAASKLARMKEPCSIFSQLLSLMTSTKHYWKNALFWCMQAWNIQLQIA